MEYFDIYTNEYIAALKNGNNRYIIRLELLSDDEKVTGSITQDLEASTGQITINYEQITRRSCSLTLINVERKYLPSKNSPLWFNRKFKLWIGLVVRDNIYWWSQGMFYIKSVFCENNVVTLEGVDKGGALDGTLKTGMTNMQYVIKRGGKLVDVLKETLALQVGGDDIIVRGNLRMGGERPIDCALPYINVAYNKQIIQSEVSLDINSYVGDLLVNLAEMYDAEGYYDTNGHFIFEPTIDNYGYNYSPTQWTFSDLSATYESPVYEYSFEGENAVCVYTNASGEGIVNVAYTAYNTNPLSPLNIGIGIHRAQDIEIPYYYSDNSQEITARKSDLAEIQSEISEKEIDITQTVYGNIDTNNRQKLVWTQENLERFETELSSWGYDDPEELLGSYSTVMGTSSEYDGVEIAYSPILQTDSGAVLLDASVVDTYISTLITNAGEGWTTEDLLALDIQGLTISDIEINKLIADVGETAIHTGEAMHYVGKDGALALAEKDLYEAEHKNEIQQIKDCRSAANYYLKRNSMLGMSLSFNCPIIPHLDVNKTIEITDQYVDIANGIFVVQEITIPLGSNSMSISATNINWLPNDMGFDGTEK